MKFHCAYCGHAIESAGTAAGTLLACPGCQATTPVPPQQAHSQAAAPQLAQFVQAPPKPVVAAKPERPAEGAITAATSWAQQFRRLFLYGLLACFVVGAVTAILGLLAVKLGELQARILLTTLSLGVYSLTGMCCAVLADQRRYRLFAGLGIAASIVGALFAILTNWQFITGLEVLLKGRFAFLIVALSFGQAALLLMLPVNHAVARALRMATLGIIAAVAMVLLSVAQNPASLSSAWVVVGVLGVLDVLGTLTTPILHLATRGTKHS